MPYYNSRIGRAAGIAHAPGVAVDQGGFGWLGKLEHIELAASTNNRAFTAALRSAKMGGFP